MRHRHELPRDAVDTARGVVCHDDVLAMLPLLVARVITRYGS